jgi:hypothetical protein
MNRFDLTPPFSEPPGSGMESFPPPETDRTLQIPRQPSDNSPLRITPGGVRRDWRLASHFAAGVIVLLLAVGLMLRAPLTPPKVVAAPQTRVKPRPLLVAPAAPPVMPPPASPSYYVPQTPAMFQSPHNAAPFLGSPPFGTVPVHAAPAQQASSGVARPYRAGQGGFSVPPAVPLPAQSGGFGLQP